MSLSQRPQPLSEFFWKKGQRFVVKEVVNSGGFDGQGLLIEVCYRGAWSVIPAGNYTQGNEVRLYDCIVDHFKRKRMMVVYEDEKFVAPVSIPIDRLQENNMAEAYDLGVCPACFTETDYVLNKFNVYAEYCEVTALCFVDLVG